MSPERITDLRQISDKVLVDLKTWLEPWLTAVRGGDGGGITEITSDDNTVTVTNPTGPVVDLSVTGTGDGTREVYGSLYNDADIFDPGSADWTAVWSGSDVLAPFYPDVNKYRITFDSAFTTIGMILVTANNNNPAAYIGETVGDASHRPYFVEEYDRTLGYIDVVTYAFNGSDADGGFNFLVKGT